MLHQVTNASKESLPPQVNKLPHQHTNTRQTEAIVPTMYSTDIAYDDRGCSCAYVNTNVKD